MQIANLVLKDNADADVTFKPLQKDGLLIVYGNMAETNHALRAKVTLGLRPSKGTTVAKTSVKVTVPYEVTLSDGSVVTRYCQFNGDVTVPNDAPTSIIGDAISFGSTLLVDDQVTDTVINQAFPY
jgi:hypothetical protein